MEFQVFSVGEWVIRCPLSVIGYRLSVIGYQLTVANCQLSTVNRQLPPHFLRLRNGAFEFPVAGQDFHLLAEQPGSLAVPFPPQAQQDEARQKCPPPSGKPMGENFHFQPVKQGIDDQAGHIIIS
ncbi:MAG: hypothetical protein D6816_02580 [Bacteroidetes bacterium]|nr:MAG: hypothetical protein D6816_02580 [Bacteroidota bacterium]